MRKRKFEETYTNNHGTDEILNVDADEAGPSLEGIFLMFRFIICYL